MLSYFPLLSLYSSCLNYINLVGHRVIDQNKYLVFNWSPNDDLKDIVHYIAHTLESPKAAEDFLSKLDREVRKIADNHWVFLSGL